MIYHYNPYELYHHGIKGQRWGVRRFQNADGSLTSKGRARYGDEDAYNKYKQYKKANRAFNRSYDTTVYLDKVRVGNTTAGKTASKNNWDITTEQGVKADQLKKQYKTALKKARKNAVKAYSKQYNKASEMEDQSDALFREAKKQYKELGNNSISRFREAHKADIGEGSAKAKKYIETWEKANKLGDQAYDEWQKAFNMYEAAGRNRISRVYNNFKYRD